MRWSVHYRSAYFSLKNQFTSWTFESLSPESHVKVVPVPGWKIRFVVRKGELQAQKNHLSVVSRHCLLL